MASINKAGLHKSCLWRVFPSSVSSTSNPGSPGTDVMKTREYHWELSDTVVEHQGRRYEIFVSNLYFVGTLILNELLGERMWPLYDDK